MNTNFTESFAFTRERVHTHIYYRLGYLTDFKIRKYPRINWMGVNRKWK